MTVDELVDELKKIRASADDRSDKRDAEDRHYDADRLLLKFINNTDVTAAFDDIEKWYA